MEGAAPTLRQSTSAQSLLTDSVGSQNSMLSHSMSKSDIFAMRRRLEAQWRMNRTRQIHELRRTFIHFCVNEGLGTATTAPTEQYDRYQADAGIKLLLPKKEVRPSRNAPFARGCSRKRAHVHAPKAHRPRSVRCCADDANVRPTGKHVLLDGTDPPPHRQPGLG